MDIGAWFNRSAWWIRWPVYQAAVLSIAFMASGWKARASLFPILSA